MNCDFEYHASKLSAYPTWTSVWQIRKKARQLMRNYAKMHTLKYRWRSVEAYCDYLENHFERTGIPKW